MKIAVYPTPPRHDPNSYLARMAEAMHLADPAIEIVGLPSCLNLKQLRRTDVAWLNWHETIYRKGKVGIAIVALLRLAQLSLYRCFGIKIITVLHNRQPHENSHSPLARLYFRLHFRLSHKVAILSSDSLPVLASLIGPKGAERKAFKVVHPCYDVAPKTPCADNSQPFSLLFFGQLRPYKNLELIIRAAREFPHIRFTIAGRPISPAYGSQLTRLCSGIPNLRLIPEHQTDAQLDTLINQSHCLLLPYDTTSSLNSGVVYYALSKGINVIVPEIATINELTHKSLTYHYTYPTPADHYPRLAAAIAAAHADYTSSPTAFTAKAHTLMAEVLTANSIPAVARQIKLLLKELEAVAL